MRKMLVLAAVVVVLVASSALAGYKLHGDDASLRAKAKILDHYCQSRYDLTSMLLAELPRPERRDSAVVAIDNLLVDSDLRSIAVCIPEAERDRLPPDPWLCTKAFKNDDACRARALRQILDPFPPDDRYSHD